MTDLMSHLILEELSRWEQAGKIAAFWLRDDDAVMPTAALDRLLDLTQDYGVPVTLAVIPERTGDALVQRLDRAPLASVAVHGWSHVNHAGADGKKQELGGHRPAAEVLGELAAGFSRLEALHAARFVPVLVPPWNRIDAALLPGLECLGYRAVSVFGLEKPSPIPLINTHIDVMDWHGTRGGRDGVVLAREIVQRLAQMFDHGGAMGLLTHHLVHDEAVWVFLEALFAVTARHGACRWVRLPELGA